MLDEDNQFLESNVKQGTGQEKTAFRLRAALLARPGIVVTDIPQQLSSRSGRK
jgi:hypothetical protein